MRTVVARFPLKRKNHSHEVILRLTMCERDAPRSESSSVNSSSVGDTTANFDIPIINRSKILRLTHPESLSARPLTHDGIVRLSPCGNVSLSGSFCAVGNVMRGCPSSEARSHLTSSFAVLTGKRRWRQTL